MTIKWALVSEWLLHKVEIELTCPEEASPLCHQLGALQPLLNDRVVSDL